MCPLALARLRRVAVTVRFEAKELRVEQDAEFDATEFRGLLHFDENPLHPISLRVTAIAPKVKLRATPVPLGSMESYARSLTGVAMPTVEALRIGDDLELPVAVLVNDRASLLSVRSNFSDAAGSRRAEALE